MSDMINWVVILGIHTIHENITAKSGSHRINFRYHFLNWPGLVEFYHKDLVKMQCSVRAFTMY